MSPAVASVFQSLSFRSLELLLCKFVWLEKRASRLQMNELADLSILKKYQKEKLKRKWLVLKIPEGQYYRPQMNCLRLNFSARIPYYWLRKKKLISYFRRGFPQFLWKAVMRSNILLHLRTLFSPLYEVETLFSSQEVTRKLKVMSILLPPTADK